MQKIRLKILPLPRNRKKTNSFMTLMTMFTARKIHHFVRVEVAFYESNKRFTISRSKRGYEKERLVH